MIVIIPSFFFLSWLRSLNQPIHRMYVVLLTVLSKVASITISEWRLMVWSKGTNSSLLPTYLKQTSTTIKRDSINSAYIGQFHSTCYWGITTIKERNTTQHGFLVTTNIVAQANLSFITCSRTLPELHRRRLPRRWVSTSNQIQLTNLLIYVFQGLTISLFLRCLPKLQTARKGMDQAIGRSMRGIPHGGDDEQELHGTGPYWI